MAPDPIGAATSCGMPASTQLDLRELSMLALCGVAKPEEVEVEAAATKDLRKRFMLSCPAAGLGADVLPLLGPPACCQMPVAAWLAVAAAVR